ncbi:hypothetical protein E2C01_053740 [Portunus trituberculatus]|uniref:Uncharacterized protein n=1 Tax=Portunus trituberculatus TaxID=210409 RepID=A0A5B7GQ58_PORTR|nr:hypothetical protein [Portunus trituberculatus]
MEEVTALLNKSAVEEAPPAPGFYTRLFVVPKLMGRFCPIIDLSFLNQHIINMELKMETVRTVLAPVR